MNKYMNDPDRAQLKTRYEFQLIEAEDSYILVLNEEDYSIYPKESYSQLKAECEALDSVEWHKEKYGENKVYYDGFFSSLKSQQSQAFGKLPSLDGNKMMNNFFDKVKTA